MDQAPVRPFPVLLHPTARERILAAWLFPDGRPARP